MRHPQDVFAGLLFIFFGVLALYFGKDYAFGTSVRMGPGYLPRVLSIALIGLGLLITVKAVMAGTSSIERGRWRPNLFIFGAILLFAFLIEKAGLFLTCFVVTLFCAYATIEARSKEALVLGVALSIFCVAVFVYGLGQPVPVWPRLITG